MMCGGIGSGSYGDVGDAIGPCGVIEADGQGAETEADVSGGAAYELRSGMCGAAAD